MLSFQLSIKFLNLVFIQYLYLAGAMGYFTNTRHAPRTRQRNMTIVIMDSHGVTDLSANGLRSIRSSLPAYPASANRIGLYSMNGLRSIHYSNKADSCYKKSGMLHDY